MEDPAEVELKRKAMDAFKPCLWFTPLLVLLGIVMGVVAYALVFSPANWYQLRSLAK